MELAGQAIKCSWALYGPLTHVGAFMRTPNSVPTQAHTAMPVHHLSHTRLLPKLFPQNHGSRQGCCMAGSTSCFGVWAGTLHFQKLQACSI